MNFLQIYVYFNGYDTKGSPFVIRVGTQKSKKSSNISSSMMASTYETKFRQSPTTGLSNVSYRQDTSSPYEETSIKQNSSTLQSSLLRRKSPSPIFPDTSTKYNVKKEFHKMSTTEKKMESENTNFEHSFMKSSNYYEKQRTGSPSYDLNYSLRSKVYSDQVDHSKYSQEYLSNKASSMRISESRNSDQISKRLSPSQNLNYRYEKHEDEHNEMFDDGVDTTPIIKVSTNNDMLTARRDSWDAIVKTKDLLSHRSLESVTDLADQQLDTKLSRENFTSENIFSIQNKSGKIGASAVKVQTVPDGIIGQPVEFESKSIIYFFKNYNAFF